MPYLFHLWPGAPYRLSSVWAILLRPSCDHLSTLQPEWASKMPVYSLHLHLSPHPHQKHFLASHCSWNKTPTWPCMARYTSPPLLVYPPQPPPHLLCIFSAHLQHSSHAIPPDTDQLYLLDLIHYDFKAHHCFTKRKKELAIKRWIDVSLITLDNANLGPLNLFLHSNFFPVFEGIV